MAASCIKSCFSRAQTKWFIQYFANRGMSVHVLNGKVVKGHYLQRLPTSHPLTPPHQCLGSHALQRSLSTQAAGGTRSLSTQAPESEEEPEVKEEYHSIISNTERSKGASDTLQFQAETKQLLNIVARSLYSEKEVFIREIISNASDALEKLRYHQLTGQSVTDSETDLEIHIAVDDDKKTFTIQDTGVGMNKEELVSNLGCIARSGSKAFLEELGEKAGSDVSSNMIGQFGVGFYSTFMVADKVEVFSQSSEPGSTAYCWSSDGTGMYEISEAEGVQRGTKIVIHLKGDCYDYAKEDKVKDIVQRYSNFVGVPIFLNGKRINVVQALWTMEPKEVTDEMHDEFYRFVANTMDKPRYHLHYKTDAPINIRALFYVPEYKPTLFDMSRETDVGVTLYSRKVMVMARANNVLPRWLRFVKGVVDSEDIPLNLSRELLQDSTLIRKLRDVLTRRLLRFLLDQSRKDKEMYMQFYEDYGLFFREGIVTTMDQEQREEIAKLMRFESSHQDPGVKVSIEEYVGRMKAGGREIFYLSAPSRQLAESSPYFEAFKKRDVEVLFLYEPYDELVLMNLVQFDRKNLRSIENMTQDSASEEAEKTEKSDEKTEGAVENVDELVNWMKIVLTNKIKEIKITSRLESHPCVVTVVEMGAARHFLKTTMADKSHEERYRMLQPTLEINPNHVLIKKASQLMTSDPDLARLLTEQLYENAMIHAGLVDDPRSAVSRLNDLLVKALDKH